MPSLTFLQQLQFLFCNSKKNKSGFLAFIDFFATVAIFVLQFKKNKSGFLAFIDFFASVLAMFLYIEATQLTSMQLTTVRK